MHQFALPDMTCGHCAAAVTEALKAADADAQIIIDSDARTVQVSSSLPRETLAAALMAAGYPPVPVN